jgi:hypothetical protein
MLSMMDCDDKTGRTEVQLQLVENEQRRSPLLTKDLPSRDGDYAVGSRERPRPLRLQHRRRRNCMRLCQVRLTNACRDGHGYADWQASLGLVAADGINVRPEALRLVDEHGAPVGQGRLRDSRLDSERTRLLSIELDLDDSMVAVIERHASLRLVLTLCWRIHEDGELDPGNVKALSMHSGIVCHLRHEPPADTLVIHFGSSRVAVAHASAPGNIRFLPLQTRLAVIAKERGLLPRYDDTGTASPFVSSACNVEMIPEVRATLRPSDAGFLQLPLHTEAIARHPDLVFSSLMAMVLAGFEVLPLMAHQYPYMNAMGELETRDAPQLTDVIVGAYRGLLQDYIDPLLAAEQRDFSHVYITHPNTYTANHVAALREIMHRVLAGRVERSINRIYPENIHLLSESDAVVFYYLTHAHKHWTGGSPPLKERILFYHIGGDTLDLTHLEVEWAEVSKNVMSPTRMRVLRRGSLALAGDRLDECIARDIHAALEERLDRGLYINPIVETDYSGPMDADTRILMDDLRTQIHKLKVGLSTGQDRFQIEIAKPNLRVKFVESLGDETKGLYVDAEAIEGETSGRVTLTLTRKQILDGANVRAFVSEVTCHQLQRFFNNSRAPELDTVLLCGKTLLWPGLRARLADSLPNVRNWVDFAQDAHPLTETVVLGTMERAFRWHDIQIEEPETVGDFGLNYGERPWPLGIAKLQHKEPAEVVKA